MSDEIDEVLEEKISTVAEMAGVSRSEILERMRKYIDDFKGLLKPDAALILVATDLGVSLQEAPTERAESVLSISSLYSGMSRVRVRGRITRMFGVLRFVRKDGTEGERAEFRLADGSGVALVVVWAQNLIDAIRSGEIREGDVVEIAGGRVRARRGAITIHVDSRGSIRKLEGDFPEYPIYDVETLTVAEVTEDLGGQEIDVKGVLSGVNPPRSFERRDGRPGTISSAMLSDEKVDEELRLVLWDDKATLLEQIPLGSLIEVQSVRVVVRDETIELHSTPRTAIKVIQPGEGGRSGQAIEGNIIYVFEPEEAIARGQRRTVVDFVLTTPDGPILGRAWGERAEEMLQISLPARVRLRNAFWSVRDGERVLNVGDYGEIEVLEQGSGEVPPSAVRIAFSLKYKRTWLELTEGEGFREIRGTVISVSDPIRVLWYCPECGSRVSKEYGVFQCPSCGEIPEATPKPVFHVTVDDGTGVARVVFLGKRAEEVLEKSVDEILTEIEQQGYEEDSYPADELAKRLVGREVVIRGRLRYQEDTGVIKLFADSIEDANPDVEVRRLLEEIEIMRGVLSAGQGDS